MGAAGVITGGAATAFAVFAALSAAATTDAGVGASAGVGAWEAGGVASAVFVAVLRAVVVDFAVVAEPSPLGAVLFVALAAFVDLVLAGSVPSPLPRPRT